MGGTIVAIRGTRDGRLLIFGTSEIWYGVTATYPAQFTFHPISTSLGLGGTGTVDETENGTIFLGTDSKIHILPNGGGDPIEVAPLLSPVLRAVRTPSNPAGEVGVYDDTTHLYHLNVGAIGGWRSFIVNVGTGEWGYAEYNAPNNNGSPTPSAMFASGLLSQGYDSLAGVTMAYGDSAGTISFSNRLLGNEDNSVLTATWQSAVIAADLPGTYKQLQNVNLDYRATSKSTVTLKISQDGGNNYEATGRSLSLASAPYAGRVSVDVYRGGAFPTIELTSTSTGFELHRIDVTLGLGGQR
jgi:hypothetical protein